MADNITSINEPGELVQVAEIEKLADFIDFGGVTKIINKLTDFAEILTEGKLSSFINYNYRLNSAQSEKIIEFLLNIGALSKIYNIASKGARDLEIEYISNIFSERTSPENISSYVSIRNILENRLSNQTQQYNVNMSKNNTSLSMPLNELRGHAKTFMDLNKNNLSISTKAQHGIIAASLHDAYITIMNRREFWGDRTYMKFFFNEDDQSKRNMLILTKRRRLSLDEIWGNIQTSLKEFEIIKAKKLYHDDAEARKAVLKKTKTAFRYNKEQADKMLITPFGKQYGNKIDNILTEIFDLELKDDFIGNDDQLFQKIDPVFQRFLNFKTLDTAHRGEVVAIAGHLLLQNITIKTLVEKVIYERRKENFNRLSSEGKEQVENFLQELYTVYFEEMFKPLFRIIQSLDMKKFACAYIIKRIYLLLGEELSNFGYFFIKVIAKIGGIQS